MGNGERPRGETAARVADDDRAFDLELVEKADEVGDDVIHRVAAIGQVRIAVAARVDGDGGPAIGERRKDTAPRPP